MWVILILSIVTVANRIHYTYLVLNRNRCRQARTSSPRLLARVLLARRAGDAPLRPLGHRDPLVHLADAAGLAARPDSDRPRHAGTGSDGPADMPTEDRLALDALAPFGPVLAMKLYRMPRADPPDVPICPA